MRKRKIYPGPDDPLYKKIALTDHPEYYLNILSNGWVAEYHLKTDEGTQLTGPVYTLLYLTDLVPTDIEAVLACILHERRQR